MQALFAYSLNDKANILQEEKKLTQAIDSCYTLYFYFMSLLCEMKDYKFRKFEEAKEKNRPTYEDLNPNTKFVDNAIFALIEDNSVVKKEWINRNVSFTDEKELVITIFQTIEQSSYYQAYMNNPESSFEEDKELILQIIVECFAKDQHLHWFFEEKNVNWFDDYNQALLILYNSIKTFKEGKAVVKPLFKNEDDMDFYKDLFVLTIRNSSEFQPRIEGKLKHWEMERMIEMDNLLLKMAITEVTEFPSIPVKVTMNEYIEIAKEYSSIKSGSFVNGMLNEIVNELKEEGKINKTGRGLIG